MTEKRFWLLPMEFQDYYGEQRFVRDNTLVGEKSLSNEEVVDLLNEQDKRINRLENYIKSDFIGSVCDNCKHVKAYHTSNWFCGVDEDIECLKGHEDMDIDDCIDFEIDLGRYE